MSDPTANPLFGWLIASLQMQAWSQLGKVASPHTGKIERDIEGARHIIDMLGMLEEKTRGNLAPEEETFLRDLLLQLRLNYVEEQKKDAAPSAATSEAQEPTPDAPA
jgi:hypothetical protein